MVDDEIEQWSRPFAWLYALLARNPRSNREVVRLAAPLADQTVLDVGCGPGAAVRRAAAAGATAIGVDPSPAMVDIAQKRSRRTPGIHVRVGHASELPVEDHSIDVAWTIAAFHHWPDRDGGLSEVRRVLRPAGRLLVAERRLKKDGHGMTVADAQRLRDELPVHGFQDAALQQVRIWPGWLVVVQAAT